MTWILFSAWLIAILPGLYSFYKSDRIVRKNLKEAELEADRLRLKILYDRSENL